MVQSKSGPPPARRPQNEAALRRLFLWPAAVLLLAAALAPLLAGLCRSLLCSSLSGLPAPAALLQGPQLWAHLGATGRYVLPAVALQLLLGCGLALLVRRRFAAGGWVAVLALALGLFPALLAAPGAGILAHVPGLATASPAPWAVALASACLWSPFVMLASLAGLRAIPEGVYEAADIDRAAPLYRLRRIVLPQVAPLLLLVLLFRTVEAFRAFDRAMASGPAGILGLDGILAHTILMVIVGAGSLYARRLVRTGAG